MHKIDTSTAKHENAQIVKWATSLKQDSGFREGRTRVDKNIYPVNLPDIFNKTAGLYVKLRFQRGENES